MFVPVKPDFRLPRFPWATALVCAICVLVFSAQLTNEYEYQQAVSNFCDMQRSRIEDMVFEQIRKNHRFEYCDDIAYVLLHAEDRQTTIEREGPAPRRAFSFAVAASAGIADRRSATTGPDGV